MTHLEVNVLLYIIYPCVFHSQTVGFNVRDRSVEADTTTTTRNALYCRIISTHGVINNYLLSVLSNTFVFFSAFAEL